MACIDHKGRAGTSDFPRQQFILATRVSNEDIAADRTANLLEWLKGLGTRTATVESISRNAPTSKGCRHSVDKTRAMMQRLVVRGDVTWTKSNARNLPSEWRVN